MNAFDAEKHEYRIAGRRVPSVTQILKDIYGEAIWSASDWYLERGRAVHACAAMIARGVEFEHDPQIAGQVAACRKFFADLKPTVLEVEAQDWNEQYMYGMTLDMRGLIDGPETIVDWKSALSKVAEIQIGGYALKRPTAKRGMVVALLESGNYKCGKPFKLEQRKNEFLATLSVFNIRRRLGIKTQQETEGEQT